MNLDLAKIKLAIFDFDDTLAIHLDQSFMGMAPSEERELAFYETALLHPNNLYDKYAPCAKSEVLYDIIQQLRARNVSLYCLSKMHYSMNAAAKQDFINRHYGEDISLVACAPSEEKLFVIKVLQRIHECQPEEILFVDDLMENVEPVREFGAQSFLASEIERR